MKIKEEGKRKGKGEKKCLAKQYLSLFLSPLPPISILYST
jgi:hypothetical protein